MKDLKIPAYRSLFFSGHLDTIIPHIFRRVRPIPYRRERIDTPDGDFLDLDWAAEGHNKKLVIFSHGLEGSSRAKYIQGMIPLFREQGFDALAWNFRSCSGEINRTTKFYHSGASHDLSTVIDHVLKSTHYESIHLIGFSMGGNITLKYLGEKGESVDKRIQNAVVFSVPLDLKSATKRMTDFMGRIYTRKFVLTLNQKLKHKEKELNKLGIDIKGSHKIWDFHTWDGRFTAPLHGFTSADDYYEKCSSKPVLRQIRTPTLIVNALNDPFLGEGCFPYAEVRDNPYLRLETPKSGGHVGFSRCGTYWSESLALAGVNHVSPVVLV